MLQAVRYLVEALCLLLGAVIAVWSIAPIYNMWEIALDSHDDIFAGAIWPDHPSVHSFVVVVTQDFWYLANFWHQFGNSFYVGLMGDVPDVADRIAGRSFTVGRMRIRNGWLLSNAAR